MIHILVCVAGYAGDPANDGICAKCSDGEWALEGAKNCTSCGANTTTAGTEGTNTADCSKYTDTV